MLIGQLEIERDVGGNTHTFKFPGSMVATARKSYDVQPDNMKMPLGGPMSGISNDFEGVGMTLEITGRLMDFAEISDAPATSLVTGTSAPIIDTAEKAMFWLEALADGFQRARKVRHSLLRKALQIGSGTTEITMQDGSVVNIPGTWVDPRAVIVGLSFDEPEGEYGSVPFSITFLITGS